MPETLGKYGISAGSKLSYGSLGAQGAMPTSWNDLIGCTEIPEIGGAPDTVESTTLDNLKYRTYVKGLQDLGTLDFPFNLESPAATANINVIAGLNADVVYGWKITYASGITVTFKSKPSYSFNSTGVNELETFTLHLIPEGEPTISVPTASV
ncbi:MAG: hypothetical protein IKO38_07115 [Erysipelotrichaceae bacterium]|nr:hypothetical protein [Erysipelotrichaceae bacterium]